MLRELVRRSQAGDLSQQTAVKLVVDPQHGDAWVVMDDLAHRLTLLMAESCGEPSIPRRPGSTSPRAGTTMRYRHRALQARASTCQSPNCQPDR